MSRTATALEAKGALIFCCWLVVVTLLQSCDSKPEQNNADPSENTPKVLESSSVKDPIVEDAFVDSIPEEMDYDYLEGSVMVRTQGQYYIGKIDWQYPIELVIVEDTLDVQTSQQTIKGHYWYHKPSKTIALEGSINHQTNTIQLQHIKEGQVDETFEGTIDPKSKLIKGTWTKQGKAPVEFFVKQVELKETPLQLFITALEAAPGDVEAAGVITTGIDEQGLYLEGAEGWNAKYTLYPTSLMAYSSYTSTARSSYYERHIYLQRFQEYPHWLAISYFYHYNYDYLEEDEEPVVTREKDYEVWMWQQGEIANIYVENPSDTDRQVYATLQNGKLVLILPNKIIKL